MATNRAFANGRYLYLPVDADVSSGDAVLIEDLPGVALTDRDSDEKATVDFSGVYKLSVIAKDNTETTAGDKAVVVGAKIYWNDGENNDLDAGDLIPDSGNGTFFGYALETIAEGGTETIKVKIGH